MISVVICSVNKALAAQVKRNIDSTIGVPWELIILDNAVLKKGITEVYNMGARQAKFDIFCFVHEDVLFRTQNWGNLIVGYFGGDPQLGLVGVAGAKYKSKSLSGWSTGLTKYDCCNILHINKRGEEQRLYSNPEPGKKFQQTVTLDGVFICSTRQAWESRGFDEKLLKGFHLYDIDFSFTNSKKYHCAVTYEIDIVHITEGGDFGNAWLDYTIRWHKANAKMLPSATMGTIVESCVEKRITKKWLHRLKNENISLGNRIRWIKETKCTRYPTLWPHAALFLLYALNNSK